MSTSGTVRGRPRQRLHVIREGTRVLQVYLPIDLIRALRREAILRDESVSALTESLLRVGLDLEPGRE